MSKTSTSKTKLLYLAKILLSETDEDHPLSTNDLVARLSHYGIEAERKSIYSDIEALLSFGLDIGIVRSKSNLYFIGERTLELPELKLLVDSVQSSRFITEKKSGELIRKLETLTSVHNAKTLQRQVFVSGRVKTQNEQIYYSVDAIHQAIAQNRKISFKYFEWTIDKKQEFRRSGEKYVQSPLGLAWADSNYYLVAYSEERERIVHFRVDKMTAIEILPQRAVSPEQGFDISEYTNRTFNMFGGENERMEILVHNSLIGVIIDRFGQSTSLLKYDSEHFIAIVNVNASPVFLGWLMSFGNRMKVLSPQRVIDDIKKLTSEVWEIYK